jgi:excisionase family DNA binding protein
MTGQLVEALLADSDALDLLAELLAPRLAELLAPRLARTATAPASFTEPLLTCAEAASRARTHVETIRRAIRSRTLRAYRVGREWRIAPTDLDAWLTPRRRASGCPGRPPAERAPGGVRWPMCSRRWTHEPASPTMLPAHKAAGRRWNVPGHGPREIPP